MAQSNNSNPKESTSDQVLNEASKIGNTVLDAVHDLLNPFSSSKPSSGGSKGSGKK